LYSPTWNHLTPVSVLQQQLPVVSVVWKPPLHHSLESLDPVPTSLDSFVASTHDEHLVTYGVGAVVDTTGSHSMAEGTHTREVLRRSIKEEIKGESAKASQGSNKLMIKHV
jgi:hypothetical protein